MTGRGGRRVVDNGLDVYAFGLKRRKVKGIDEKVREMLDLVELDSQARNRAIRLLSQFR